MNKLSYKIMLDRYSEKDLKKTTLNTGIKVVATVDETNPLYPQKEICYVTKIHEDGMLDLTNAYDDADHYTVHKDKISIPTELEPEQLWRRMAKGNARNEVSLVRDHWEAKFNWALLDWRFVSGGRIMAMLGSNNQDNLTAFNCFVLPCPEDSRQGAIKALDRMIEIMARGGGVGINLSTLRPRNAIVKGVNGTSSGAVSWGGGYSYYTGLIEQGGSRRGALLEGLSVWHPDIEEFITIKKNKNEMLNANLSVLITEDFMDAVKNDREWILEFPDTTCSEYEKQWDGNLDNWKSKGLPVIPYKKVSAKYLWNLIMESNWANAEPGVIWLQRYNKLSNSWYIEEIVATNPCGEQGLPPWGVCNLGHVNLAKVPLLNDGTIDWAYLNEIVRIAIRFLDNVIDITPYFFKENEDVQKNTRRIGMGTMGLAELLIKLKIRYGSKESLKFIDKLYEFIRNTAYDESVEIAREKGSFPLFDAELFLQGEFISQLPQGLKDKIRKFGIRNIALLTQAPTGSTGTMCDTSTGIEPFYDWVYYRYGRLGKEIQYTKVVEEYFAELGQGITFVGLPKWFVTAKELTPEEHVLVMAIIQKYTDSSISKTVNCPEDWTVEQVEKLYMMAYDLGCKGLTIYRDKSRDSQVLESIEEKIKTALPQNWGEILPIPKDTIYRKAKFNTGCGKIKIMIGTSKTLGNRVIDLYAIVSSAGGCHLNIQGEAIAISRYLRCGGDINDLMKDSIELSACPSYQFKRGQGNTDLYGKSCFNGLVRAIVDFQNKALPDYVEVEGEEYEGLIVVKQEKSTPANIVFDDVCPSCKQIMVKETGCYQCKNCGFSKCNG